METKSVLASKTMWANVIAFIAAISTSFGFELGLDPETQLAIVGGIMAALNIVLRFVTKSAVSIS